MICFSCAWFLLIWLWFLLILFPFLQFHFLVIILISRIKYSRIIFKHLSGISWFTTYKYLASHMHMKTIGIWKIICSHIFHGNLIPNPYVASRVPDMFNDSKFLRRCIFSHISNGKFFYPIWTKFLNFVAEWKNQTSTG